MTGLERLYFASVAVGLRAYDARLWVNRYDGRAMTCAHGVNPGTDWVPVRGWYGKGMA